MNLSPLTLFLEPLGPASSSSATTSPASVSRNYSTRAKESKTRSRRRLGGMGFVPVGERLHVGMGRETAGAAPLPGEQGDVDARGREPGEEAVTGLRKCHETEALQGHHILPQSTDVSPQPECEGGEG